MPSVVKASRTAGIIFFAQQDSTFSDSIVRGKATQRFVLLELRRNQDGAKRQNDQTRSWVTIVLTDIHFWVPVAVLIGGLLLLRFIH